MPTLNQNVVRWNSPELPDFLSQAKMRSIASPRPLIYCEEFSLRPFHVDDAQSLSEAIEESRTTLRLWQNIGEKDGNVKLVCERISLWTEAFELQTRLQYGLVTSKNEVLGGCALEHIDWGSRTFQLGYWLRTSASGRGYATAAVRALTVSAFRDLDARRVAIWTDALNIASIRVAERLQFSLEGRLHHERLNAAGDPQDTLVFARVNPTGL